MRSQDFHGSARAAAPVTQAFQFARSDGAGIVKAATSGPDVDELLCAARSAYGERRRRDRVFGFQLSAEPAWDILLDLFIADLERREVSIKSACVAASVPPTTGLRYIAHLVEEGLVGRSPHPRDSRSSHVSLTELGHLRMVQYFALARAKPDEHSG